MATDPDLAVRHAVVRNLVTLHQVAQTRCGRLADEFVAIEKDAGVMQGFAAAFLGKTRDSSMPPRTETMLFGNPEPIPVFSAG